MQLNSYRYITRFSPRERPVITPWEGKETHE
nr:MAG TPA: hypothetical protein [Bacteriophage sp.]